MTKELSSACKTFSKGDFHPIYTEDFQASYDSLKASWKALTKDFPVTEQDF